MGADIVESAQERDAPLQCQEGRGVERQSKTSALDNPTEERLVVS